MKSLLENKSENELRFIAEKLGLKGVKTVSKKRLIERILEVDEKKLKKHFNSKTNPITFLFKKLKVPLLILGALGSIASLLAYFGQGENRAEHLESYYKLNAFDKEDTTVLKVAFLDFQPAQELMGECPWNIDYENEVIEVVDSISDVGKISVKFIRGEPDIYPINNKEARSIMDYTNSNMVLWGRYIESVEGTEKVRIRYTLTDDFFIDSNRKSGDSGYKDIGVVSELKSGEILCDVEYVINWICAMEAYKKGDFKNVLKLLEQLNNQQFNNDSEVLLKLGQIYFKLGRYDESNKYYKSAQISILSKGTIDSLILASLYNDRCVVSGTLGQLDSSITYGKKALEIRTRILGETDISIWKLYNNLATAYYKGKQVDSAKVYFEKSIPFFRLKNKNEDNKFYLGGVYQNLGVLNSKSNPDTSVIYLLLAIELLEEALNPLHPKLASAYSNIGTSYGYLANPKSDSSYYYNQRAMHFHERALDIRKKVLDEFHPQLAISYNNIAYVANNLGDQKKAIEFQLLANSIFENVLPPGHEYFVSIYLNLSTYYLEAENYQESLLMINKAQKIAIKEQKDSISLAKVYGKLYEYHFARSNYNLAQKYLDFAIERLVENYPPKHPELIDALNKREELNKLLKKQQ